MCNKQIRFIAFVFLLSGVLTIAVRGADPNLVGWWAFEEESGVLNDQSDYQNHGIPTGGVIYKQSGIKGFSMGFNGIDSYVTVGKNGRPQDTFTFGGWIRTSLQHEIDPESAARSNEAGVYNQRYAFFPRFEMDDAGAGLSVGTNGISVYESGGSYLPATAVYEGEIGSDWNHIMVVYTERTPTIFLNGQAVHTGLTSGKPVVLAPIQFGGHTYGFFDGQMDEILIYNRALEQTEIEQLMLGAIELASAPTPGHGESDVLRDVVLSWTPGVNASQHDVYFGMVSGDVNDATTTVDPAGAYMGRQDETTYTLGRLDFGQTYYWRVDEITPGKIVKGDLWQFTVEPLAYALAEEHITATASSSRSDGEGPERTIDGSGLDVDDLHGTKETTMWLSRNTGTSGAWIQYEFDLTYLLHQMLLWNYNSTMESFVGFGVKDVTIDTSINGSDWVRLGENHQFAQAPGAEGYAANTVVDFGNMPVKAVRLNIASNWGDFLQQYGLSEVRFTVIPLSARMPNPATGSTGLDTHTVLSWRAGRQAAEHDVYLSTDEQAVIDGTAPVTTVSETSYDASGLDLGVTYYWKVNEVNEVEDPALWEGDVWSFTVMEFLTVEDFEDYNDFEPDRIFDTWIDGWDVPTNGSQVGYAEPPFAEQTIVHEGKQSMPFFYNNTGGVAYSEAGRTFDVPQDWTRKGVKTLTLWFRGQVAPGSFSFDPATQSYTVIADGVNIGGTSDHFHFVYKRLSGDGSITAKVESVDPTHDWAKAGVMIRDSLDADSANAFTLVPAPGAQNRARIQYRISKGDTTGNAQTPQNSITLPHWVRLTRTGNSFTGEHSADGVTWETLERQAIPMGFDVYIGLAYTSHVEGTLAEAVFSNVSVTPAGQFSTSADIGIDNNLKDQLYVALEDGSNKVGVVNNPDPYATQQTEWQEWNIDLKEFTGVDLSRVKTLYLGVGDKTNPANAAGLVFIDTVRLYGQR